MDLSILEYHTGVRGLYRVPFKQESDANSLV